MEIILYTQGVGLVKAKKYAKGQLANVLDKKELDKINQRVHGNVKGYRIEEDSFLVEDNCIYVPLQEVDTYHDNAITANQKFAGDICSIEVFDGMLEDLSFIAEESELAKGRLFKSYLKSALKKLDYKSI